MLRYIPFLTLPLALYAVLALPAGGHMAEQLAGQVFAAGLMSGVSWRVNLGDLLIGLAIICQACEVVRSARPTNSALAENMAGVVLWIIGLVLFLMAPGFGTSVFALMLLLLLADYLTDSAIMVFTAKRSIGGYGR